MLNPNATLHDGVAMGEQQSSQAGSEQAQQSDSAGHGKSKGSAAFSGLFKQMSHALYLWMD